jgi:hypothetical protein
MQAREVSNTIWIAPRGPIKRINKTHPRPEPNRLAKYNTLFILGKRRKEPLMAKPAKKYGNIDIV